MLRSQDKIDKILDLLPVSGRNFLWPGLQLAELHEKLPDGEVDNALVGVSRKRLVGYNILGIIIIYFKKVSKFASNGLLFQVTNNILDIKAAFEKTYRKGIDGFTYMLERTFYRPRDVISYVNHAIENATNKKNFSLDVLKRAEIDYSIDRLNALEDEWGENYGEIRRIMSFLNGRYNGFSLRNIKEDDFYSVYTVDDPKKVFNGELLEWVERWRNDQLKFTNFLKKAVFLLYQLGVVGIKIGPEFSPEFVYQKNVSLAIDDVLPSSKVYVHKAFYSALKINVKELEPTMY